ncbi:hypothetical protein EB061_03010 [bacterium]|jgi:hypothetical protein|nr:hypothetical protein [bacterium]
MKGFAQKIRGQAILEYVILLGITVGIGIFAFQTLNRSVDRAVPKIGGNLEKQLRSGAAPANLWRK